jgi:hypothetical protein
MHFWFLFHLPVQRWLRRGERVPDGWLLFLVLGSAVRLGAETLLAPELRSWDLFSVYVSEFSAAIFYYACWPHRRLRELRVMIPLGVLVPLLLITLEQSPSVRSWNFKRASFQRDDSRSLGCGGSSLELRFPLARELPLGEATELRPCGFAGPLVRASANLGLRNDSGTAVNLRLYRLHVLHGKVSWRFLRLIQLPDRERLDLGPLLKGGELYLLKAPERRSLGHLVILRAATREFPLGSGVLELDYDSINWRPSGTPD